MRKTLSAQPKRRQWRQPASSHFSSVSFTRVLTCLCIRYSYIECSLLVTRHHPSTANIARRRLPTSLVVDWMNAWWSSHIPTSHSSPKSLVAETPTPQPPPVNLETLKKPNITILQPLTPPVVKFNIVRRQAKNHLTCQPQTLPLNNNQHYHSATLNATSHRPQNLPFIPPVTHPHFNLERYGNFFSQFWSWFTPTFRNPVPLMQIWHLFLSRSSLLYFLA